MERGFVEQPAEQGIQTNKYADGVLLQFFDKAVQIARIGNQNAFCACLEEQQQIYRERKNMIHGQCRNHGFLPRRQFMLNPLAALQHIGANIAVCQHGAFGNARGTAGVLQEGQIFPC